MRRSPMRASLALVLGLTLICALLWLLGHTPPVARAATITVTNTNDSGPGSLRQALLDAAPDDTIDITATGTISLTGGELVVTKSLTILGPGAGQLAVDGLNATRVFSIASGDVSIFGLTIQNGNATGDGGGIYAGGSLTLTRVVVVNNIASGSGGGVACLDGNSRLINAVLARNTAGLNGAALYFDSPGDAVVLHTTIASPTPGLGAAIYVVTGTVGITDTMIASYTVGISNTNGAVYEDYNLFYGTTTPTDTVTSGGNSFTGDPAFLDPANDDYHLTTSSAAIDAGVDAGVTSDLDGAPRPYPSGGSFDIGAYEATPDVVIAKFASPEPAIAGTSLYYTITIFNRGYPTTTTSLTLSDTLPPSTTLGYVDQTDDDGSALGFGGGITQNVQWNDPRPAVLGDEWLGLVDTFLGTGVYTSRVMDASSAVVWNSLRWTPWRPYGKELPDDGQAETAYRLSNANMAGNDILLHLNESAGATVFSDTSGLGHDGTCPASAGETCPNAGAAGRFNSALSFDGALSNTVVITDAANPARYAIELWVRPSIVTDTSFILRTDSVSGTSVYFSHLLGISGDRFLHLVNDGSVRAITGTTVVTPGVWYHVVGTAQSGGELVLYVNGAEEGRLGNLGALWSGGDQYRLGSAYGVSGTTYFSGDLDEVAVYSRTLSAAEVNDHYLRGALRLSFQVRSCDDALCDTETFVGPGGLITTSYSELNNPGLGLPLVALTGVPVNRYFQYRATFETDAPAYSPQLRSVTVGPNHYAIDASQGSCGAPNASAFTCTLGSLAGGGVVTITTQVALHPSALGIITNTAILTAIVDSELVSDTAIVTTTVGTQSDLRIAKEDEWNDGTDPVNPGSPMTYTLRVYNAGPSTAWSVTVTDTLPITASGIITPANWSCQSVGNAITCTTPSLLRYVWYEIVITGTAPLVEGVITNTAWITTATETDPANNSDTQTTLITPLADLVIVKSAEPNPVNPGETLTYTLLVTNSGPYTATNVIVTDTLQSGLMGRGFGAGWACSSPGNVVICSLLYPLTPTYSASFNITVTAPMSGLIANTALVISSRFDPDMNNNLVTTYAAVRPVADLAIAKSDTPDPVWAGSPLTYTLIVTNTGPVPAGALTTTLAFTNPTYIGIPWAGRAWPYPSAISFSSVPGLVRNMTVTLNSFSHTYPGDVSVLLVGPGGQSVVLMSSAGGGTGASGITLSFNDAGVSLPANDALTSTTVYRPTNYGIGSLPAPAPSGPHGGSLSTFYSDSPNGTWQLYVYDSMDSDGGNMAGGWSLQLTTVTTDTVTLTDTLPAGLTGVSVSAPSDWMCANVGGELMCTVNSLPVSVPATLTLAATAPITGGVITNTASITSTTTDLYPADNSAIITTTVLAVADLQISKSDSPDPVGAGRLLTYTLTFTNVGPSPVASATIYDVLPVSVTLVSAPGCDSAGNVLTCTVSALAINVPSTVLITVLAPPDPGVITNTATITLTGLDPDPLDNTAWVTTTVTPLADLWVTKTGTPDSVWPGGVIVYTVVVGNDGPSVAESVRLTDTLPVSVTFQSIVSSTGWTCSTPAVGSTGDVVCTIASLPAGETATFTITVVVPVTTAVGTLLTNVASINSDTPDPVLPNTATADTSVSLYKLYLPVVFRNYAFAPDLIVQSVIVTSTGVQVVIKNQGDAPITQTFANEFWVDLYVNPNPPPTGVNQIWRDGRSAHGIVWGITQSALPLAVGGTITLTGSTSDPYYRPDLSDMAWPLTPGTVIYVQVDSANTLTNYGAVLENHEIAGNPYNNIAHTMSITGTLR